MPPQLDRVDHIHVSVADRKLAELWYREVLGFRRRAGFEVWAVPHGPLMLENPTGAIVLALFEKPRENNSSVIAMGVTGPAFLQWLEHLSRRLQKDLEPVDHGLAWSLYFSDPDDNPFEITTYDYDVVKSKLFFNVG